MVVNAKEGVSDEGGEDIARKRDFLVSKSIKEGQRELALNGGHEEVRHEASEVGLHMLQDADEFSLLVFSENRSVTKR